MPSSRSVEGSRRPFIPGEARKVGSTYVVDQSHGQPPRIATSSEVFQALERGSAFPKGASQLDIRRGLQARNSQKP